MPTEGLGSSKLDEPDFGLAYFCVMDDPMFPYLEPPIAELISDPNHVKVRRGMRGIPCDCLQGLAESELPVPGEFQ